MEYFILDQHQKVISVDEYLAVADSASPFCRFVRREACAEILVPPSESKPEYLKYANAFGFHWEQRAEGGQVQYDYKANLMRRLVMDYARQLVHEIGLPIYEVSGANMFNLSHPVVEAYASLYGDRLYQFKSSGGEVVMSYDASYPQFNLASKRPISYRQLPFAHFSLADCYRQEQSGELMLLLRQRRFYMPDLHPYFQDMAEAFSWFPKLQAKIIEAAAANGKSYQVVVEVPSWEIWRQYEHYLLRIPRWLGADVLVKILADGNDRYWIVNVDYKIVDQLGQSREIACIQVDVENAARLGISYVDQRGAANHPVIIHSAIPGGIERFLYVLFDDFKQGFPQWLHPVQIRLLPVNDEYIDSCEQLVKQFAQLPLRIEVDDRPLSISAKLKAAHADFVPHKVVIGPREEAEDFRAVRELAHKLAADCAGKPFIPRRWPLRLSVLHRAS